MRLTVYIPTFQRNEELEQLLTCLEPQITDGVEAFVSDNDGGAEAVVSMFPKINYIKRWSNIGCDGNCLAGLTVGTGEYVWILGDDDRISSFVVADILKDLDGVDRLILTSSHSGECLPGYQGTMANMFGMLHDKSFIVASTLCSMNVWRRKSMEPWLAIDKLDTRNVLAWAGLKCKNIRVSGIPGVWVNSTNLTTFDGFGKTMNEYIQELCAFHEVECPPFRSFMKWNYTNVVRR